MRGKNEEDILHDDGGGDDHILRPKISLSNSNSHGNTGCELLSYNGCLSLYSRGPKSSGGGGEVDVRNDIGGKRCHTLGDHNVVRIRIQRH